MMAFLNWVRHAYKIAGGLNFLFLEHHASSIFGNGVADALRGPFFFCTSARVRQVILTFAFADSIPLSLALNLATIYGQCINIFL